MGDAESECFVTVSFMLKRQGHLVLNKFSDCLNFWIFFFRFPGAVANREETPQQKPYRAWSVENRTKNRKLNSLGLRGGKD